MSFQTTADLEPLSNYSRRAEGWGREIVIGLTKDDITGMILAIYWKCSTSCMAGRGVVEQWPEDTLHFEFKFHTFDKTFKVGPLFCSDKRLAINYNKDTD